MEIAVLWPYIIKPHPHTQVMEQDGSMMGQSSGDFWSHRWRTVMRLDGGTDQLLAMTSVSSHVTLYLCIDYRK